MSATATIGLEQGIELLREAASRNTPAEMHFRMGEGELATARVRLLGVDTEHVYVDHPRATSGSLDLKPNRAVVTYFMFGGVRYAFRSRISRPRCFFRLNETQQIAGTALLLPKEIVTQQRRADFRLSLAGCAINAEIHAGTAENGGHCPIATSPVSARMVNISASGLAAMVDKTTATGWAPGQVFFATFILPGVDTVFYVMMELRHARPVNNNVSVICGFQLVPWDLVPTRRHTQMIARFIADEQRRQLRRGR